jgi:hypothetical protein
MNILYITFLISPIAFMPLYRSKILAEIGFYRRMVLSTSYRKLFTLVIALWLMAFHFLHVSIFNEPTWLLPSTILAMAINSFRFCERMFYFMQNRLVILWISLIAIACFFIPFFLPMGFTLIILTMAALFYTSHRIRE